MRIKKISQSIPKGQILNIHSTDDDNTYSCDYINNLGTKKTTLWAGEKNTTGQVTLNDDITNYDAIGIVISSNATKNRRMDIIYVDDIEITTTGVGEINLSIFQSASVWVSLSGRFTANNVFNVVAVNKSTWNNCFLIAIYGIKF